MKKSLKSWDDGARVRQAFEDPTYSRGETIATDYSRYGYGGDRWQDSQREIDRAAGERFRAAMSPGVRSMLSGAALAAAVLSFGTALSFII